MSSSTPLKDLQTTKHRERIICVHGAAGAGKTTMLQMIHEYLGNDRCIICLESIDHMWRTSAYNHWRSIIDCFSTTMIASKWLLPKTPKWIIVFLMALLTGMHLFYQHQNITILMAHLIFTLFAVTEHFFVSLLLSKLWNYYSNHYINSLNTMEYATGTENKSNDIRWKWFDRNCVDIYGFCCIERPLCVPGNFLGILKGQTNSTYAAVIMDPPKDVIYRHLASRICGTQSTRIIRIVTKLLIKIPYMVETTLKTIPLIELWYFAFNVPVIKISQLYPQLDKDENTNEICWTKKSIDILINAIEEAHKQKQPYQTDKQLSVQEELISPWLTRIRKELY